MATMIEQINQKNYLLNLILVLVIDPLTDHFSLSKEIEHSALLLYLILAEATVQQELSKVLNQLPFSQKHGEHHR